MDAINMPGYREGFARGYQQGCWDSLERTKDVVSQAINQIPNVIQINIDPNRLTQLEEENCRLKATVEAAWKILCNRSCDECGEDLDDPANCMNCTMKHSLDVIPKLRKVLLAALEEATP